MADELVETKTIQNVSLPAIIFQVRSPAATIEQNDAMYVVGNLPCLGSWNTSQAVPMWTSQNLSPVWVSVPTELPTKGRTTLPPLEYKYFKKKWVDKEGTDCGDGDCVWEPTAGRILAAKQDSITIVSDTFGVSSKGKITTGTENDIAVAIELNEARIQYMGEFAYITPDAKQSGQNTFYILRGRSSSEGGFEDTREKIGSRLQPSLSGIMGLVRKASHALSDVFAIDDNESPSSDNVSIMEDLNDGNDVVETQGPKPSPRALSLDKFCDLMAAKKLQSNDNIAINGFNTPRNKQKSTPSSRMFAMGRMVDLMIDEEDEDINNQKEVNVVSDVRCMRRATEENDNGGGGIDRSFDRDKSSVRFGTNEVHPYAGDGVHKNDFRKSDEVENSDRGKTKIDTEIEL